MKLKTKLLAIWLLTSSLNSSAKVELEPITIIKWKVEEIIQPTNFTWSNTDFVLATDAKTLIVEWAEMWDDVVFTKKQREVFSDLRNDLQYNMQSYTVNSWDTIADISNRYWLKEYHDLVLINSLLWNELKSRNNWDTIIIKKWEEIFVPKTDKIEIVIENLDLLRDIKRILDLNKKIDTGMSQDLLHSMSQSIYPKEVQWVWIEKMFQWFIEAQKQEFDPYLPHIVDVERQETVSCANLIRTLLAFAVDKNKLTDKEKVFFQKQWLDAWILPDALKNIWYVQSFNLMDNFSAWLVWSQNPIPAENQENYDSKVIELSKYIEQQWIPGSILPLYFRYSHYKWVVAEHNRNRKDKHYNTHQTTLAGIDSFSFDASNVWFVNDFKIAEFSKNDNMSVFDFLTNFIQQRADYWTSALADWQKKLVQKNLHKFSEIIHIKVNWKEINLSEEFQKEASEMLKIQSTDKIEVSGPIMIDGLHMVNSSDPDKVKNMNARTRFLWELIWVWTFVISEYLEPAVWVLWVWSHDNRIIWDLETKWIYSLKKWDTVESAIKAKILVYEKDSFDKLDKNDQAYEKKYKALLNYFYALQINALKISGYMQSENDLNDWAFNINAPIPYYSSENINKVFKSYISEKKKQKSLPQTEISVMKSFVQVTTLPGDSYRSVLNRIRDEILLHAELNSDFLPHLHLFSSFNELQQRKFLALYIKHSYKTQLINPKDFLNGKISEWVDMIINLEKIDKIIEEISVDTHSPDLQLTPVDEFVIDLVSPLAQNNNILENVINMESYTPVWSNWFKRLYKQMHENNNFLKFTINFDYYLPSIDDNNDINLEDKEFKFYFWIKSYWDFQLRPYNLYDWLDEEWPNREQLLRAFSYFETEEFKDYIANIDNPLIWKVENEDLKPLLDYVYNPYKARIENDLDIVRKIKFLIISYDEQTEEVKKIYLSTIVSDLKKILLMDDWTWKNIVWKIIGASLTNDNINLHIQKLNWILQASWERIEDIYDNELKMQSYEKVITLINNLWEAKFVYWLAENYLMRIIESVEKSIWKKYEYPKMKKTFIWWQLVYWPNTFKKDLIIYKDILSKINNDLKTIYDTSNINHINIKNMLDELLSLINSLLSDESTSWTFEWIYNIFKNSKIKDWLLALNNSKDKDLITSILPIESEFIWNDFRNSFFRYINTRDIKRESPWFISKLMPNTN